MTGPRLDLGGKSGLSPISHLPASEIQFFASPCCRAHDGHAVGHPLTPIAPANCRVWARLRLDTSRGCDCGGADLGHLQHSHVNFSTYRYITLPSGKLWWLLCPDGSIESRSYQIYQTLRDFKWMSSTSHYVMVLYSSWCHQWGIQSPLCLISYFFSAPLYSRWTATIFWLDSQVLNASLVPHRKPSPWGGHNQHSWCPCSWYPLPVRTLSCLGNGVLLQTLGGTVKQPKRWQRQPAL